MSPRTYATKFYGRLWLIRSILNCIKIATLLWGFYTIPFGFILFRQCFGDSYQVFVILHLRGITDEGSVIERNRMARSVNSSRCGNGLSILWKVSICIRNEYKQYLTALLNRSEHKAPVRHTLQPLCDLSATKIQNDRRDRRGVATRFCSWSPTRRRLVGD